MSSSRLIPNTFDASQASLSNSTVSLDGNKSEISPSAIPNILALPAILPAKEVALLGLNDFPDFPLGFPPGFGAVALGFRVVPPGLTSGFGVVPPGFGASSYFHPSHLKVDPDGGGAAGGAAGGAVNVLAIDPALAFTLKLREGAECAAAPVPAVALALKAVGGVGDAVGAVATGEAVGKLLLLGDADNISLLFDLPRTFPQFGAVLVLTRALDKLASLYCLGTISFTGATVAGAAGAAGGAGVDSGVLLNKLDALEVYSLTFSLNGTLLKYSLALVPKFLNIEGFGELGEALAALAALSLSAL